MQLTMEVTHQEGSGPMSPSSHRGPGVMIVGKAAAV